MALSDAPDGSGGWLAAPIRMMQDDSWAGHIRAGIQLARGNSDLTDLTFAVELDRVLDVAHAAVADAEHVRARADRARAVRAVCLVRFRDQ